MILNTPRYPCPFGDVMPVPLAFVFLGGWRYNPDNVTLPDTAYAEAWYSQPSAIDALGQMVGTFRKGKAQWGWVWSYFWVLHVLGDLHQPMHAVSGYFNDTRFGNLAYGDRGGNSIPIHSQWSVCLCGLLAAT